MQAETNEPKPVPADGRDDAVEALVHDIIGKVADRWTTLRFTQLGKVVGRVSQKMLTQTLRRMEEDGLVRRTVHPVIPPHVDYALTPLGESLTAAFCGVWLWAEKHHDAVTQARHAFAALRQARAGGDPDVPQIPF